MIGGKKIKPLVFVSLALVLALSLVAGACAPAAPEEAAEEVAALESKLAAEKSKVSSLEGEVSDLEGEVSDLEGEIAELRAPAEVFEWKFQTWATPGDIDFAGYQLSIEELKAASDGRIDIELFGVGVLVGGVEAIEAEGAGIIDGSFAFGGYYSGYDFAFGVAGSPASLFPDFRTHTLWFEEFGGIELMRELYGGYNIYYVCPIELVAEAINSVVPIRNLDDLQGLKIRLGGGGFCAEVFTRAGAVVHFISGGEIYSALDTGLVEAGEFVGPTTNWALGLHEVTDYVLWPAPHNRTIYTELTLNMDVWEGLPDNLKDLIHAARHTISANNRYRILAADLDTIDKMVALGLEHTVFAPESWKVLEELSFEVALESKEKSPMSERMITSQLDLLERLGYID